jgi:cysteine desulfurase
MTQHHSGLIDAPIYLDYNATTPVDPRVAEAALPYLTTHFGNPSSAHRYAERPRRALTEAREQLARLIGAGPDQIVFTGSGSEADTLAIRGTALANGRGTGVHLITQATEHPAVLRACAAVQRLHGVDVTYLPVDHHGRVDPGALQAAITPRTALVSIMAANNETGVLQPVEELARIAHDHGIVFHTDAAQAVGKIPLDVNRLGVDLLTVAGHKMYAPKGVGALYVRPGLRLEPTIHGGGQEHRLRAGTENVALAVALGAAAHLACEELTVGGPSRLRTLRDLLHRRLTEQLPAVVQLKRHRRLGEQLPPAVQLNGHPTERLPNTLNVSLTGVLGHDLLATTPGIAAATGSACHADTPQPSPVLLAMGHHHDRALSALRLTLGRWTTPDDIEQAAQEIAATARRLLARTARTP